MVTLNPLIASAYAGSKVKKEVTVSKLYPLYGHFEIGRPYPSVNDKERGPHFVNPSAEPQLMLTVSDNFEI